MKRLTKPQFDSAKVYDTCVNGIDDSNLAQKFIGARSDVVIKFQEYELRANTHQLFLSEASLWGDEGQIVLAGITKKEFIDLYTKQMVNKEKTGRGYYNQLTMLAPLGKCPYCWFGQISALDHFLSKARYPLFSVLCENLVPACSDCNKLKTTSLITNNNQIPHPYFEGIAIETDSWLFAEVNKSTPAIVNYFVMPPDSWPNDLAQRVKNYFISFDLARRFAIEATTEMAGLTELLDSLVTKDLRNAHLSHVAQIERQNRRNSWKAALYEALANSDWFQHDGYRNLG